eukprot:scaffold107891_cov18-Phaeocystis_antarctica.AAC.1
MPPSEAKEEAREEARLRWYLPPSGWYLPPSPATSRGYLPPSGGYLPRSGGNLPRISTDAATDEVDGEGRRLGLGFGSGRRATPAALAAA